MIGEQLEKYIYLAAQWNKTDKISYVCSLHLYLTIEEEIERDVDQK